MIIYDDCVHIDVVFSTPVRDVGPRTTDRVYMQGQWGTCRLLTPAAILMLTTLRGNKGRQRMDRWNPMRDGRGKKRKKKKRGGGGGARGRGEGPT